jgi:transposase
MRRGFDGLSAQVQTILQQQPFSGHVFVFRGRRGDIVKLLWWDGDGLCLFAKRLEGGRFISPKAENGTVRLSRAQLSTGARTHGRQQSLHRGTGSVEKMYLSLAAVVVGVVGKRETLQRFPRQLRRRLSITHTPLDKPDSR